MIDRDLLNLLPPLRRARGDRLYGPDQKHWVDLWKQDGAWLLGHRPEGAAKAWKNEVDKGLAAWAPSAWPRRLEKLIPALVPGTAAVRLFRNGDRAGAWAAAAGASLGIWRPWDDRTADEAWAAHPVLRLTLPTGPGQAVAVVFGAGWTGALPDHDVVSPAEASALVAAAAQVRRFDLDPRAVEARRAAVEAFDRCGGPWVRQGLWFVPRDPSTYPALFRAAWEAGFFLNPDPTAPSLIAPGLSEGEWKAWASVGRGQA